MRQSEVFVFIDGCEGCIRLAIWTQKLRRAYQALRFRDDGIVEEAPRPEAARALLESVQLEAERRRELLVAVAPADAERRSTERADAAEHHPWRATDPVDAV